MSLILNMPPEQMQAFAVNARRTGIVMVIIGLVGIVLPNLISLTLNMFIGAFFLLSAAVLASMAWYGRSSGIGMWLKPALLLGLGLLVIFHPAVVLSVLGLLLAIYFLLSGFASLAVALDIRPDTGWVFLMLNGVLSLLLGAVVLALWPLGSAWMIGLLIGINFLFEGMALISLARQAESAGSSGVG